MSASNRKFLTPPLTSLILPSDAASRPVTMAGTGASGGWGEEVFWREGGRVLYLVSFSGRAGAAGASRAERQLDRANQRRNIRT